MIEAKQRHTLHLPYTQQQARCHENPAARCELMFTFARGFHPSSLVGYAIITHDESKKGIVKTATPFLPEEKVARPPSLKPMAKTSQTRGTHQSIGKKITTSSRPTRNDKSRPRIQTLFPNPLPSNSVPDQSVTR